MILVVDDDRTARELMVAALELLGEPVVACAAAQEALREIALGNTRLVLTDRRLAGTDGLELVRAIRRDPSARHIPVLVVSGDPSPRAGDRARAAGADGFLMKPVHLETLLREVGRLLSGGRS